MTPHSMKEQIFLTLSSMKRYSLTKPGSHKHRSFMMLTTVKAVIFSRAKFLAGEFFTQVEVLSGRRIY